MDLKKINEECKKRLEPLVTETMPAEEYHALIGETLESITGTKWLRGSARIRNFSSFTEEDWTALGLHENAKIAREQRLIREHSQKNKENGTLPNLPKANA
jgi:hypothetical protein